MNIAERLFKPFTDQWREILPEHVVKVTVEWGKNNFPEESPLTPIAKKVLDLVDEHNLFGCQKNNVLRLLSVHLEEKIVGKIDKIPVEPMIMVVPLGRGNGHNYPSGKPVWITQVERGFRIDGTKGNLITSSRKELRPATEGEIAEYFREVPSTTIWRAVVDERAHWIEFVTGIQEEE